MTNKCFISLVIKALGIKKKFRLYKSQKELPKTGQQCEEVNKPQLSDSFNTLFSGPENIKPGYFDRFLVEDSINNFILKSVIGFLGGVLLTYVCFMFLIFSLNFTLKRATYICIGLGVILSLGLAFSVKIRCTVFLCIPQLFSKRGRQALLAYAFILALSGPAKNTLHNVEVMSESLACTQEQLKQAENDLIKCVQKPNTAAKKPIEKLLEKINSAVKDFKNFILQLYKNCFDILETVLHAQQWLYSITYLCHRKIGKPAHRCLNLLAEAMDNCEQIFHMKTWHKHCKIPPEVQECICSTDTTYLCAVEDMPESLPVSKLKKQLDAFKHRAMNILYVGIEAHQTYSQTNRSYTYHEEYQGMATEIRQKTDQFLQYFDVMSVIFGIFILVLFVKVIIYRHKFLTEDHFDNRYITRDFVDIDNTRAAFRMETLLPLTPRERLQYIKVTSLRLVPCERVRLLSSFVFLIFATFKIIIHMLTDSSLYWILSTVRRNERFLYMSTLREEESLITVEVFGEGLVAELVRNVTGAVKREATLVTLDPTPCLPDPVPPDWNRYYQILALVLICWLLALWEPYGLRLRHSVMVTYHPDRARERAIWLYNKIISNRISFVKVSRRRLRLQYKDVWIKETCRYKFMRKASTPWCLLCKATICVDSYVKCPSPECAGTYCSGCFSILKFCSICSNPVEYGDPSDLSEEKDSSEEECPKRSPKRKIKNKEKIKNKKGKKKREEIEINLKNSMTQNRDSEGLLQPRLLCRALNYCRRKMPNFKKLRSLSDFESSDWDNDSLTTESSTVDCFHSTRRIVASNAEKSGRKERTKAKQAERRTKKKEETAEGEDQKCKALEKLEKSKQMVPKVCLFRKVWPSQNEAVDSGSSQEPKSSSKGRKKGESAKCAPLGLLQAKDSIELIKQKHKGDCTIPDSCQRCDTDVIVDEKVIESEIGMTKFHARFFTQSPGPQIFVGPLEVDVKYFERKKKSQRRLRFIDPVNIHEIEFGTESDEEKLSAGSSVAFYGRRETVTKVDSPGVLTTKQKTLYKSSRARVCYGKTGSSDSVTDSVKICLREGNLNSSSESDCQYYYEPVRSSNTYLPPKKRESVLKRASAKLNLNSHKFCSSYLIETDSSNDNFLSVKPSRRRRGISQWSLCTTSSVPESTLANRRVLQAATAREHCIRLLRPRKEILEGSKIVMAGPSRGHTSLQLTGPFHRPL